MYDLLIANGRVLDPSQGIDGTLDIAVEDGRIAAMGTALEGHARRRIDASGLIVAPGLIDLHVHIHWGVSHYGVMPDTTCLARGVTTAVDAGSAGGHTWPSLKRFFIERSETRLLAYLNIAYMGMIGDQVGELEDARFIDKELAIKVGAEPEIVGIKSRMDRVGPLPATEPLARAVAVAEALDKPMMVHIGREDRMRVPLADVLALMRPGDQVTHCYHGHAGGIVDEEGTLRPCVVAARERGVLFDVGHGGGSFTFRVARAALRQGFSPDVISSDLHTGSLNGPVYDLVTTMNKFWHMGMSLPDVIEKSTAAPARILGMADEIGTLAVGACADITLLDTQVGRFPLQDCERVVEYASRRIVPVQVVRGGKIVGY